MSDEDYEAQLALSKNAEKISFTPEGSNYYVEDTNDGYGFLSSTVHLPSVWTEQWMSPEEPIVEDVVVEPKPTMNTPWSKASSLRGNPMDLINMNY